MPAKDERWLQKRFQCWYCVLEIPRSLRVSFAGKRRLIKSLQTDNLILAQARRHAVLADWKRQFESQRVRRTHDSVIQAAIEWREHLHRQTHPEDQITAEWDIETSAADIADPDKRETFLAIATGQHTPFEPFLDTWLTEQDIEERSKGDHRRAVRELLEWASEQNVPPTIEAFDRRVAGVYVSYLLARNLDRSKTVSKRLWSLSRLWSWLGAKGYARENIWRGHDINRNGRSARDKEPERPFSGDELKALFTGDAKQPLLDMMRMGFFTGATIEEIALIRVEDIDVKERTIAFRVDPKTPARRRVTPIHPDGWKLVQARTKDKAPDAFLFHELGPAPAPGRQRSMAISKAFGRYRQRVGVHEKKGGRRSLVNFHSFRRTFITLAEQAGQPESTIQAVVGHKRKGMTFGVYSGGPSLEQRRNCVESVKLPELQTI